MLKQKIVLWFVFSFFAAAGIAAANDLSADEKKTVAIFKQASPKVVYVHRLNRFETPFSEQFEVASGTGSGIFWDKAGHIITNYHVVHGASHLMVSFGDKTVAARVIGAEPRKDIAVLQLDSVAHFPSLKHFTPFKLCATDTLVVGQKTIAIGNPFGLDHSLTTGVISALGREVPGAGGVNIKDMIQTDASINPGNSGGPLLDSHGCLIGLNTMIYSNTGGASGVGFAVPAETISRVVPQLIQHGRVKMSGIGIVPLDARIANHFVKREGVFISKVFRHTPADKAGLKGVQLDAMGRLILGDAILAINHKKIKNYNDLYNTLSDIPIGSTIQLRINRHGHIKTISMKTVDLSEA